MLMDVNYVDRRIILWGFGDEVCGHGVWVTCVLTNTPLTCRPVTPMEFQNSATKNCRLSYLL